MKVAIDAQLTLGTATGIGEYVAGLVPALRAAGVDVTPLTAPRIDPWRFDRRVAWDQLMLPRAARGYGLLHCAAGTVPLLRRGTFVVTVHDVAWLRTQAHARPYARWYFGAFALRRYGRAARIMVDSEFSRDELLALSPIEPARIAVVYPGVRLDFGQVRRDVARIAREPALLLCVGTIEQRKNLETVIRALPALRAGLPGGARLVAVGPPTPYREHCLAVADELNVTNLLDLRGYVTRDALLALYAQAAVAVVPSRYEGFGYAAAQALCAGVPLVAADASSLPEVVRGSSATLVPPDDPTEWAKAVYGIVSDYVAAHARAQGDRSAAIDRFSWHRAAAATASVYAAAVNATISFAAR